MVRISQVYNLYIHVWSIVPMRWRPDGNNNLILKHLYSRGRQSTKRITISAYIYIYITILAVVYVKKESRKTDKNKSHRNDCRFRIWGSCTGEAQVPRTISGQIRAYIFSFRKQMHFDIGDQTMVPNTVTPVVF